MIKHTLVADPFAQGGLKLLGCNTDEVITNVQVKDLLCQRLAG